MFQTGSGRVASLHLHPEQPGVAMNSVEMIEVVLQKGIVGNGRYFGRIRRISGEPGKRQVTLIEREQIAAMQPISGCPESTPAPFVRTSKHWESILSRGSGDEFKWARQLCSFTKRALLARRWIAFARACAP